ncbi:DNA-binding helix-turn-helix protein [Actinomyces sp. oral taxon 848 str. F0332]|jgi:DNA-binding protein|nr:DNA-binding helix-turn-helix protein [Actinomyces sp. oral taxon 848 str. F0332]
MPDSSPLERQLANIFAMTIRARRKELGLSQEQVALRADIDRNHYQLMESARSDRRSNKAVNPRLFTLFRLANALELPVEDLLLAASETFQEQVEAGETL